MTIQIAQPVTQVMVENRLKEVVIWITSHMKIIDKKGELVPLNPNPEQQRILWYLIIQEMLGEPVRMIILKSRKVGCSTIIEAYGYYLHHTRPNMRGLVAAQDDEASQTIFNMTGLFHEENPEALPMKSGRAGKRELLWKSPHRSRFSVQTAGKVSLARGDTLGFFHASEIPYWPHPKQTLLSALNAVPDDGGIVVLESTAHGFEEFKVRWDAAIAYRGEHPDDMTGYIPLFFSWLDHEHYKLAPPTNYDWAA